eukprot:1159606-Pelagomonas_calceolata.AAC.5
MSPGAAGSAFVQDSCDAADDGADEVLSKMSDCFPVGDTLLLAKEWDPEASMIARNVPAYSCCPAKEVCGRIQDSKGKELEDGTKQATS